MSTKQDGDWGEALVEKYLSERGCRIVEREWRCRFGEIDLIAESRDYIVFVEVKLRRDDSFAAAREFVTAAKQNRIRKTALLWLSQNPTEKQPRFDVIEIYAPEGEKSKQLRINHIENAFE